MKRIYLFLISVLIVTGISAQATFNSATIESKITAALTHALSGLAGQQVSVDDFNESIRLNSSSSPDAEYAYVAELTLTGGTDSLDLYDGLTDIENSSLSLNGKKVRMIKFKSPSTNSGNITIADGENSGYQLLGDSFTFIITPGQSVLIYGESDTPAIGSSATSIDYSGTASDVLQVIIIFG